MSTDALGLPTDPPVFIRPEIEICNGVHRLRVRPPTPATRLGGHVRLYVDASLLVSVMLTMSTEDADAYLTGESVFRLPSCRR